MYRRLAWLTLALIVMVVMVAPALLVRAQEPDTDNDPYDQTTCQGVSEDDVEDVSNTAVENPFGMEDLDGSSSRNLGNDPDEFSPFPNGSFQMPFELGFNNNGFSFVPTYTEDERSRVNDSYYPEPSVDFTMATPTAEPGQEVTMGILPSSFAGETLPGRGFYAVAFVDGIFLNGRLAGADADSLEGLSVSGGGGRPDCGVVNRVPATDQDGDGMDDEWELRYGLDPTDPSDAGSDLDQDGYVADAFANGDGELVNPAPPIAGGELGDGVFTALEEFILGTDPTAGDTDGDGFADEADAVGLGQSILNFVANKPLEAGSYQVHVIVVGLTEKKDEEERRLVKIDSAFREVRSRRPEDLQVELRVVTPAIGPGETLEVRADPAGSDTRDLLQNYRWSIDGVLQTAQTTPTLSYVIPDETVPGTTLLIELELINPQTGQLARGRVQVVIGDHVLLQFDPQKVEPQGSVTVQALLTAGQDPSNFLYNWTLDRDLDTKQSKLGANSYTLSVTNSPGTEHQLLLEVFRREDSSLFGQVEQTLLVQPPVVTLQITPAEPRASDQITVEALTEHFGSDSLIYTFTVDGQRQVAPGPQIVIPAGQAGSLHELLVDVVTSEAPALSASDQLSFTTLENGSISAVVPADTTTGTVRAALASGLGRSALATVAGVAALVGGVVLVRRWAWRTA